MASVQDRVKSVTARILEVDESAIKDDDNFSADLGAESIQSIELVASFEEEFGIEMDEEQALSVDTVEKAVAFIAQVCQEQGVEV